MSQYRSSQDRSIHFCLRQDRLSQDRSRQDRSSQERSGQVESGQVLLRMEFDSGVGPTIDFFDFHYTLLVVACKVRLVFSLGPSWTKCRVSFTKPVLFIILVQNIFYIPVNILYTNMQLGLHIWNLSNTLQIWKIFLLFCFQIGKKPRSTPITFHEILVTQGKK